MFPNVDFRCESAESLSFDDSIFDVVFESALFMMLTCEEIAQRIAGEMLPFAVGQITTVLRKR